MRIYSMLERRALGSTNAYLLAAPAQLFYSLIVIGKLYLLFLPIIYTYNIPGWVLIAFSTIFRASFSSLPLADVEGGSVLSSQILQTVHT